MSKVGIYAIFRVHGLLFGDHAGPLAGLGQTLIWWLALGTLVLGVCGMLGARSLRSLLAWQVMVSVGTLLAGWALGTAAAWQGALFYLLHSTWLTAAMFLLAGVVVARRGVAEDGFMISQRIVSPAVGLAFLAGAIALIGLPPLSGFVGKALLLQAASTSEALFWVLLLLAGLVALLSFARAGSTLFWRGEPATPLSSALPMPLAPVWWLLPLSLLLVAAGDPILAYLEATAVALKSPQELIDAVLGARAGGE